MTLDAPAAQALTLLENRTYDELQVGDTASLTRTLTKADIELFAILSGDVNPAHLDEAYAKASPFHKVIAHGMWGGTLISTVLGTRLPGPGTIYLGQQLRFTRPVGLGDIVTVTLTVKSKGEKHHVLLDCVCTNQLGQPVITGKAEVMAPTEKIRREATHLPELHLVRHERFGQLMARVQGQAPIRCAVVCPHDLASLNATLEAARAGLIHPVLVGDRSLTEAIAREHQLDLAGCDWAEVHGTSPALQHAMALARVGTVEALLQGDVPSDVLLHALVSHQTGLRAHRRISHAYVADVPDYAKPLLITDAAVNLTPSLADKRDIVQNAIDLARTLGIDEPKVAILSAVDGVRSALSSSMDAAALCKMLERHQIAGGIVDGPLGFDAAISPRIAQLKHPHSAVAGQADILVVPTMETGDMLVKQLTLLADADVAGIVLGARVPVILGNATDSARTRLASAALALLVSRAEGLLTGALHSPDA